MDNVSFAVSIVAQAYSYLCTRIPPQPAEKTFLLQDESKDIKNRIALNKSDEMDVSRDNSSPPY